MNLEWITQTGLLDPRPDTGILLSFPLNAKRAIVEQVVAFFHNDYNKACESLTDLAKVKWVMECFGATFTLPLPACEEIVSNAIDIYSVWLTEPRKRPPAVRLHLAFLTSEMIRHLSLMFERQTTPYSSLQSKDAYLKLCTRVLELFASLGHVQGGRDKCGPPSPTNYVTVADFPVGCEVQACNLTRKGEHINGTKGVVRGLHPSGRVVVDFGPQQLQVRPENLIRWDTACELERGNWECLVKVVLGITDFLVKTGGLKELQYVLLSVLYEVLLRSKLTDDTLWMTVAQLVPNWVHYEASIRQWTAALKALTLAILPSLRHSATTLAETLDSSSTTVCITWGSLPKGFRVVSVVEMTNQHALLVWIRFFHLVRDINSITDPRIYSQALHGIRTAVTLLSRQGWLTNPKLGAAVAGLSRPPSDASPRFIASPRIAFPSPSAKSIVDLCGDALFESVLHQQPEAFKEGRACALGALCDIFIRAHPGKSLDTTSLQHFYGAVKYSVCQAAECESDDDVFRQAVLQNTAFLFCCDLPGVHSLVFCYAKLLTRFFSYLSAERGGGGGGGGGAVLDAPSTCRSPLARQGAIEPGRAELFSLSDLNLANCSTSTNPVERVDELEVIQCEDYDTDDDIIGPQSEISGAGSPEVGVMKHSCSSLKVSPVSSPGYSPTGTKDTALPDNRSRRCSSPQQRNRESPVNADSPSRENPKWRATAFTLLASLLPVPSHYTSPSAPDRNADLVAIRSDFRRLLLTALTTERDPQCLMATASLCTAWTHMEITRFGLSYFQKNSILPDPAATLAGAEAHDPLCLQPETVLLTVLGFKTQVCHMLESIQTPNVGSLHPPEVYLSCLNMLQQAILPFSSATRNDYPHPIRALLISFDPNLTQGIVSCLSQFVLLLYGFSSGRKGGGFKEKSLAMLVAATLECLSEWLSASPDLLGKGEVLKQVLQAVDTALGLRGPEYYAVPAAALEVFRVVMNSPTFPPASCPETSASSSTVTEAHLVTSKNQSVRWFGLDGTRLLTVIEHATANEEEDSAEGPEKCEGGVTMILRDAFGRYVWDARLVLDRYPDEPKRTTAPAAQRRHGISMGPEGMWEIQHDHTTLREMLEPIIESHTSRQMRSSLNSVVGTDEHKDGEAQPQPETLSVPLALPPSPREKDAGNPVFTRLLLNHLQLVGSSAQRLVEFKDTDELRSAIAMLDATPPREVHMVPVLFMHREGGTEVLRSIGVEWYLERAQTPHVEEALPSLSKFTAFISSLGWPVDPGTHGETYVGGALGEKTWRRQRLPYYADSRQEIAWPVTAVTPATLVSTEDDIEAERWEDRTPVRVVWIDTPQDFNPTALDGETLHHLMGLLPPWGPRKSQTFDFVVRPLRSGLYAIRIIHPLGAGPPHLCPTDFTPTLWHAPLADGSVVTGDALPCLLRNACLTASKAFRRHWQSTLSCDPKVKDKSTAEFIKSHASTRACQYTPPALTRGMLLHKICVSACTVSGECPLEPKYTKNTRVACIRAIELKGDKKLCVGDKGTIVRVPSQDAADRVEVLFDNGITFDAYPNFDVVAQPDLPFTWSRWRSSSHCPSVDLGSLTNRVKKLG